MKPPTLHIRQPLSAIRHLPVVVTRMLVAVGAVITLAAPSLGDGPPTPEEYVAHVGGGAKILAPGEYKLDGNRQWCGKRPVVIDDKLDDYGAAYPGFLIFNSKLMSQVSTPVKFWIFAHECAHQFRGPDEMTADCFAVQRGRRQGWLTIDGVEEICRFIAPAKGDMMHFSGSHRCEYMRKCYTDTKVH